MACVMTQNGSLTRPRYGIVLQPKKMMNTRAALASGSMLASIMNCGLCTRFTWRMNTAPKHEHTRHQYMSTWDTLRCSKSLRRFLNLHTILNSLKLHSGAAKGAVSCCLILKVGFVTSPFCLFNRGDFTAVLDKMWLACRDWKHISRKICCTRFSAALVKHQFPGVGDEEENHYPNQ